LAKDYRTEIRSGSVGQTRPIVTSHAIIQKMGLVAPQFHVQIDYYVETLSFYVQIRMAVEYQMDQEAKE